MLQFNEAMLHHDPANGMMDDFFIISVEERVAIS